MRGRATEPVRVAVVGAGYWGPNVARNVVASRDARLAWVCDVDEERAGRVAGSRRDVRVTSSLDDVLDDRSVDGVCVATPASTHSDVALACLEAGKHVLVEKPLATSVADGEKLVAVADARDLALMCDHTYCYTPPVQRIHDVVAAGGLGQVQYVDSVRINLGLVQSDIDVFWDLAPHDLSILDFVLPPECRPVAVAAQGADPIGAGRTCLGYLTLRLGNGALAHVHVNWLSPVKIRTTIFGGTHRIAVWDDLNPAQRLSLYDKGVDLRASMNREAKRDALVSYRVGDMVAPALPEREALQGVIEAFAAAIRLRVPPPTDGASGLRVLEILEAIPRSLAREGASVDIGGTTEEAAWRPWDG